MQPLIDLDILLYEVSVQGQYVDEETGKVVMLPFDNIAPKFDQKIEEICAEVWATKPPILFMSHNKLIHNNEESRKAKQLKRVEKKLDRAETAEDKAELEQQAANLQPKKYNPNFREDVAKKKVYKGNRKSERPKHFLNLVEYARANYEVITAEGLEADDLLGIYQTKAEPLTTIICSRDKDLKIIEGMHYGWESGYQQAFPPTRVDKIGTLEINKRGTKVSGTGLKFFYSQVLTGDVTDNYPGCPRIGAVKAYNALANTNTEGEMFEAVLELYRKAYGEEHDYRAEMLEQARLAHMVTELDEDGLPVMWEMYDERT